MKMRKPYLIFLGDVTDPLYAKTAFGVRDWAREDCLAQWALPGCNVDLGLPRMEPSAAFAAGARSLLIGIAPDGGRISTAWHPALLSAARSGLDIVSGMHMRLEETPGLSDAATEHGATLINIRTPPKNLPVATGLKRSGKRLLTVGTDCALGKKYTALTLTAALRARGVDADFRATGQTGIVIAGAGLPIDSIVADFVAGAAEMLSPAAAPEHWDVIEGQGSLFHPSYAGVTLGLLHGSQPDALVLCHDPTRAHIQALSHIPLMPLDLAAERYLQAAQLTNPAVMLAGVSLNTSTLNETQRERVLAQTAHALGVPCFDPLQTSAAAIVDRLLSLR